MNEQKVKILLTAVRQALLMVVDALEVFLEMERTSEIRKKFRELAYQKTCQTTDL